MVLQELKCSDCQTSLLMQGATARLLWLACLCLSLTAGEAGYARYSQHRRRTLRRTFRLQSSLPGTSAVHTKPPGAVRKLGFTASNFAGSTSMSGLVQQSEVARQKQLADPATAYVAACLAVRDQHADIREWLDYHQRIGVRASGCISPAASQGALLSRGCCRWDVSSYTTTTARRAQCCHCSLTWCAPGMLTSLPGGSPPSHTLLLPMAG